MSTLPETPKPIFAPKPTPEPKPVTITLPAARLSMEWSTYDHMTGGDSGVHPAEQCAVCGSTIHDDVPVRKGPSGWAHEACALAQITGSDVDAAWLLLADQVVARPSAFRAGDVKAIMRNVAVIARRAQGGA